MSDKSTTTPRSEPFNAVTESRYGQMIYNRNDIYIGKSFEKYGEFSYGEAHLFESVLKPGMTVVEIGANIGSHTICLSQLVGDTGRVYALEPQRLVFQLLCGNMAINSALNVECLQAAAGSEKGSIMVPELDPRASNNVGGLGLGGFDSGKEVPVMTIDSLGLKQCHFIKADVEGMEEDALRGAEETIKRCKPILYVENDREKNSADLVSYIDSLDYQMFWHIPRLFNEDNHKQDSENIFKNIASHNMLCLHKSVKANVALTKVDISLSYPHRAKS